MALWNGQDLSKGAPNLGFTLASAQLIPQFVEQALGSGLFVHTNDTQLTPLDDVKEWMRADPWRAGELFEEVGDLLLAEERKTRKVAEKAGVEFDVVGFELAQMDEDSTFETFNPAWTGRILKLVIEEADTIQAWCKRVNQIDFALAVSFQLSDPRQHPKLSREEIAQALADHGAPAAVPAALLAGRAPKIELSGAFQLDYSARDTKGPSLERHNGVGFVRIPCTDSRASDETTAHFCLAYPLESEGYFLKTFDALRQHLTLKDADAEA